ncbi:MAG: hypothetical protein H6707_20210 [Deltaproteobacteria bacterium]|nr:hypothetical protein [Deltaproteobacteria bacterium]
MNRRTFTPGIGVGLGLVIVLTATFASAVPRVSPETRSELRQSMRKRIGSYSWRSKARGGRGQWVWKGAQRPKALAKRPAGLRKMPSVILGDISGFFVSHDSTQGRVYFEQKSGKGILVTRGTKGGQGPSYKTALKYFELNLSRSERKLIARAGRRHAK